MSEHEPTWEILLGLHIRWFGFDASIGSHD